MGWIVRCPSYSSKLTLPSFPPSLIHLGIVLGSDPRLVLRDHDHSDRHASIARVTKGASGPRDGESPSEGIVGTGLPSPRTAKDGDDLGAVSAAGSGEREAALKGN